MHPQMSQSLRFSSATHVKAILQSSFAPETFFLSSDMIKPGHMLEAVLVLIWTIAMGDRE